jgi:predicted MFS family arabinose efflux permease
MWYLALTKLFGTPRAEAVPLIIATGVLVVVAIIAGTAFRFRRTTASSPASDGETAGETNAVSMLGVASGAALSVVGGWMLSRGFNFGAALCLFTAGVLLVAVVWRWWRDHGAAQRP